MKKNILKSAFIVVLALSFASFTAIINKDVKVKESTISWKGYKVTGSHEGNISLNAGTLQFENDKLVGGDFTIDMTTISVTDLKAGRGKEKLEGHLKSDDFFGIEKFPKADFKITKIKGKKEKYEVTGDLTIKGKTMPITFAMTVTEDTASANLKIDRTKFGIEYKSSNFFDNLKDKAIYDEFDLNVTLKF